jgi:hypothetical protein
VWACSLHVLAFFTFPGSAHQREADLVSGGSQDLLLSLAKPVSADEREDLMDRIVRSIA